MENQNLLLSPDLLRLAKLTPESAKEELFDSPAEDGGEPVLKPDAASILASRIVSRMEQERRDKLGQGIKTHAQKVEAVVRPLFEEFGVADSEDVLTGLANLAEKIELLKKEKPSLANLTDEEVAKLPAFQRKLNAELQAAREAREALQRTLDEFAARVEQEKKDNIVFGHVEATLRKANAAFGANPSAQLRHFFNGLDKKFIHLNDDGGIDLLDENGIALRGPSKEILTFEEYVIQKWRELGYGIKEAEPASPAPGKHGKPGGFTSSAQAQEALKSAKTPEEKREILAKIAELLKQGK